MSDAPSNGPPPARGQTLLGVDPRSLGLGRIALGLALLFDLARRAPEMSLWYSNDGLLPNHTVLWQPIINRLFSAFFTVSLPHEAALVFTVCGVCYAALTVGFHTRLFQVLSLLSFLSLRNRVIFLEGEGTALFGWLALWTMFLPLGRRFSVDAVRASLRARPEHNAAALDAAGFPGADRAPVVSLAALAVRLQLAAALILWWANRSGAAWKDGTAVHYLLHQDRVVRALGLWAREHAGAGAIHALTWGWRWLPLGIGVLVLLPVGRTLLRSWARRAAAALTLILAAAVAALVNDGLWSVALLAFLPFLMTARDWEALAAQASRRERTRLVVFDGDCGICFQIIRVLRRMDRFGRLRFVSNDDTAALPAGIEPGLLERTILVVDPGSGRRWTRAEAFAEIARALPAGGPLAVFMNLPVVRTVAGAVYDRVAGNRTRISVWLGLAACGIPTATPAAAAPPESPGWVFPHAARVREAVLALFLLMAAVDALATNPAAPAGLRDARPAFLVEATGYTGLAQIWTHGGPDAPLGDRMVFVDALTADGRHIDPLNAAGSRVAGLPVTGIPPRLGQSALFAAYEGRIPDRAVYFQALLEWVLRTPERTDHPADRIAAFDFWALDDDSPPPGETQSRNNRPRLLLHHEVAPRK